VADSSNPVSNWGSITGTRGRILPHIRAFLTSLKTASGRIGAISAKSLPGVGAAKAEFGRACRHTPARLVPSQRLQIRSSVSADTYYGWLVPESGTLIRKDQ
jgi:hypothetical protein